MGKMMGLKVTGCAGQSLRPAVYLRQAVILLASFFFFLHCYVYPYAQDSKGVKIIEVKKNEKRIILYEASYALLIGVSKYKYNDWPPLPSVPEEMRELESLLRKRGFIIQTILNPTCEKLKETIEEFISSHGLKENNRLLIFFSGHGFTRKKGKKGYIVPADAPSPKENKREFIKKAIEMQQIKTWAMKIESKHALFVFDSCFSGTIFLSRTPTSPPPEYITDLTGKSVRQFITSGSAGETVPAQSEFIKYFIRGIEGEVDDDKDGYITASELGAYLHKKITELKIGQTPQVGKIRDSELNQGDFVFISDPPPPPPSPIEMVRIPSSNFLRGASKAEIEKLVNDHPDWKSEWFSDETPQKEIYLDSFYISKYEITNAQYKTFLEDNPNYERPAYWNTEGFNDPDQPVVGVSWDDADAFCNWLSEKTGENYRLPTEAEWEKAARGTDGRFFPWGNEEPDISKANFMEQHHKTVSVKEKPSGASAFKLMHMAGNVAEWCGDWYDESYYRIADERDPNGPSKGARKVVRGGAWKNNAFFLRCADRNSYPPKVKKEIIGFRIVRIPAN